MERQQEILSPYCAYRGYYPLAVNSVPGAVPKAHHVHGLAVSLSSPTRNLIVDTVNLNLAQPRQRDKDNNSDNPASAFGLSVTAANQPSGMCGQSESQSAQPDGSCKTKVCTKSAVPYPSEVARKIVRADTGPDACLDDFEYWVDEFLSIPVSEYLKIDEDVLARIDESYRNYAKDPQIHVDIMAIMKIKYLLNRVLCDWQLKQNGEQVRKQLISLYNYTKYKRGLIQYVRNWVFMKYFKDMLCGREVSDSIRKTFLTIVNEVFSSGPAVGMGTYSVQYLDVISLGIFYFIGGLPDFKEDTNYEKSFKLMYMHQQIVSEHGYLFFSPVSFTALDYMRFSPKDITQKLDDQKKMLPGSPVITVIQLVVSYCMLSHDKAFPEWLSRENDFNLPTYVSVRDILIQFYEILAIIASKCKKRAKELPALKDELFSLMQKCEKLAPAGKDDFIGLFNLFRAQIILSEKELQPRLRYAKVASLFAKVAQRCPNHWSTAYSYYCMAGIRDAAVKAAQHYVRYWQGRDATVAEYWRDRYSRELLAPRAGQQNQPSGEAQQQYDIDTILREFGVEQSRPKPVQKIKSGQKKTAAAPGFDVGQNLRQAIPCQPEPMTSSEDVCPDRPVIKALPCGVNLYDGLSGEYHIKGPQGAIRPFEKLLSRHWNPLVKKTLNLIRAARNNCDLDQERSIYHKLLNNPTLKTCIGIERIWEEYAWTELHQFDDCFKTRVMSDSLRPKAQKWINTARDSYIMPSLAYCLGLDQIYARIEPEAIWEAVLTLVEQPELAQPEVNQEIRFRLRCLFSSMGHTYSIAAMANPEQSQQLMEVARKWYSFKTIDPQYDQRKGLVLQ